MIFSTLQNAIVTRLLWDAYFTLPTAKVTALAENALDLLSEYEKAIGKFGIAAIVATPSVTPGERIDLATVTIVIGICEHVSVNRGRGGANKPASDVGAKAMALLRNWSPNADLWAPLQFVSFGRVGEDEKTGADYWELTMLTQTMLELFVTVLGTEDDVAIGDENEAALIVSPTAA